MTSQSLRKITLHPTPSTESLKLLKFAHIKQLFDNVNQIAYLSFKRRSHPIQKDKDVCL